MMRFFIFLFFSIFSHIGLSQFYIGPRLGLGLNTVAFEDKDYKDSIRAEFAPAFNFGAALMVPLDKAFSLQVELNYSQKIKKTEGELYDMQHSSTLRYIEVPMLLRYETGTKVVKTYFGAGPTLSYWLGGTGTIHVSEMEEFSEPDINYKYSFGSRGDSEDKSFYYVPDPNRLQVGLTFCVGTHFQTAPGQRAFIEARFDVTHTQMANSVPPGETYGLSEFIDTMEVGNRTISISAGYLFPIDWRKVNKSSKSPRNNERQGKKSSLPKVQPKKMKR